MDKSKSELYIGLCYRRPDADPIEIDVFKQIREFSKFQTMIFGDFNYSDIDRKVKNSGNLVRIS